MDSSGISNGRAEIVIQDLVKDFGDVKAVNGLSLEINNGEMFGFLGPSRRGQDDHDQHAQRPAEAHSRISPNRRL